MFVCTCGVSCCGFLCVHCVGLRRRVAASLLKSLRRPPIEDRIIVYTPCTFLGVYESGRNLLECVPGAVCLTCGSASDANGLAAFIATEVVVVVVVVVVVFVPCLRRRFSWLRPTRRPWGM